MGAGDSIKPVNLSACSLVLRSWPLRFEDESFAPTDYKSELLPKCLYKSYLYDQAYIHNSTVEQPVQRNNYQPLNIGQPLA